MAVAACVAVVIFLVQPRRYRATADVVVPVPTETGSLIAAVGQSVSDFEGALRSSVVAQRVSAETGVPAEGVAGGLESEQLSGGTVVEVGYTADDPDVAEAVAASASREALGLLLRGQLAPFEQQRELAEEALARASQAYEGFLKESGLLNPDQFFRIQTLRLIDLQDRAGRARNDGDEEAAEELDARFLQLQLRLAPMQVEFTTLREALTRAASALTNAEASYAVANAALEAAEEGTSVQGSEAVALPRAAQLLRQLLVIVVLATALAIALIVLMELTSSPGSPMRRLVAREATATARPVVLREGGGGPNGGVASKRSGSSKGRSRKRRRSSVRPDETESRREA